MGRVFIYWDSSNMFHEAQRLAEEQELGLPFPRISSSGPRTAPAVPA